MADGKTVLLRLYDEVVNQGDLAKIDELCSEDFVDHEEFPGIAHDRSGVHQFMRLMREAFPDFHMEALSVAEQGDHVLARFRMTGTHQGDFMGVPPTGRRIDIEGYDELRVVDGRATEHWGKMDGMEMMQQLGAAPAPAA